jgi:hypothetical protein
MVYLAPDRDTQSPAAAAPVSGPKRAGAESGIEEAVPARINAESVADKVYRLMQRDLTLELERVTRLGG